MQIVKLTILICIIAVITNAQQLKTRTAFTIFHEKGKTISDTVVSQIQQYDKSSKLTESKDITLLNKQKYFKLTKYNAEGKETELVKSYFDGQIMFNQRNIYNDKGLLEGRIITKYDSVTKLSVTYESKSNGLPERINFLDTKGNVYSYIIYSYNKDGLKTQQNEFKFPNYLLESEKIIYDDKNRITEVQSYESKQKDRVKKLYTYNVNNKVASIIVLENDKKAYDIVYEYDNTGLLTKESKNYIEGSKVETYYKYDYWN